MSKIQKSQYFKQWRENNPNYQRNWHKSNYNIQIERPMTKLEEQKKNEEDQKYKDKTAHLLVLLDTENGDQGWIL